MSEPQQSGKTELETVVSWRMIAAGAGVGAAVLVATAAVALLARPDAAPAQPHAAAPQRPVPPSFVFLSPPKRTAVVEPPAPEAAPPELLPPPVTEGTVPPPPVPVRVAVAPAPPALPPATEPVRPPVSERPSFKRIRPYTEDELLDLLARQVKEVDLDGRDDTGKKMLEAAKRSPDVEAKSKDKDAPYPLPKVQPLLDVIAGRDDLKGLPLLLGHECQSSAKAAQTLGEMSRELRTAKALRRRAQTGSFHEVLERDQEVVKFLEAHPRWRDEVSVPGLVQMFQAENAPVRQQVITMLSAVEGERAGTALARRAIFDTSPAVREVAVKALAGRPRAEYRGTLLDGMRYPWPPAAEHAAEALVALKDHESVFELAALLDEPNPAAPALDKKGQWQVTEVVRVNHLRNCLLCHAPSFNKQEPIRGLIPEKGQPLPNQYYESEIGPFVRADVVYLKQDFSVTLPVPDAAPWPALQRFDYVTRKRAPTKGELDTSHSPPAYPQRLAVLWALRELTGEDAGYRSEDWKRALVKWYFGIDL